MPGDNVTILHLSDLQFGKNHRFAGIDLSGLANPYDTLLERLWEDLQRVRKDHCLEPDLLIVTGDLTEWGMHDEFKAVREFLEKLADKDHLKLSRECVAIVPGNHDINRDACHSYFLHCRSEGTPIVAPWWPKWRHFATMFSEFYHDVPGVTFTADQQWTLFEIPDLKVVIAGLNSTMVEGHDCQKPDAPPDPRLPRHVGYVGEPQLRWFADRLENYREKGWVRIGVVHHNKQRLCKEDEENLEDADLLEHVLGSSLNMLLHGHIHEAKLAWLNQRAPIIATGSAALVAKARPVEIPNQYQVLQVSPRRLRRFGRAFLPESKTFGPDPRVGKNDGLQEEEIIFTQISGTFPGACTGHGLSEAAQIRISQRHAEDLDRELHNEAEPDNFLTRVAEICKHRRPAAAITTVSKPEQRLNYLRVVEQAETIVRQYPVGVFEFGFTREDLDRFRAVVDAPYRAGDSGLISEIVYSGERPAEELIQEAGRHRIRLQSFAEYQGLIDFTPYVQNQTTKLDSDPDYPPKLYVPQRMRFHIGQEESLADDALAQVQDWLIEPHPRFVLILGDFGTGKTFLLHELARRMCRDGTGLTPLFIELRALEKAQTLDALVAQHLARSGVERIDLPAFNYMLNQGRIVLFFDGFDELALRVSYERAAEHFDTLVQAATGDAKVVVTSRTQHFESDKQVRTVLYERAQPLQGLRYCKLQPFTETQIKRFLLNRWGLQKEADHWFDLLKHVKDLLGLSENPRMLGFITELSKDDISRAKRKDGNIAAADLYRLLLERWLGFEYERAHPRGAQEILPQAARWAAVTAVAIRLWEKTEKFVSAAEIAEVSSGAVAKVMTTPPPSDIAGHLIGSGSLLRRDDEGCFFFVHQSVMEWLVALEAAGEVKQTGTSSLLGTRGMSQLMAEFFCDLAKEAGKAWARGVAERVATDKDVTKGNALEVLKRLGMEAVLNLAGQDLRGQDFADQSLVGADLSGADLTDARLVGKDLSEAKLDCARLIRANLAKATLTNASLEKADLTGARLLGAHLEGARFVGASLCRAGLTGARRVAPFPADCDLLGAALPEDISPLPFVTAGTSACNCMAWHPTLGLVATGSVDKSVRLWEAASGKELRQFTGHQDYVRSVAFSPDGKWLVSSSADKTVRLWEVASGKELRQFTGHHDYVRSVAFSPDGRWLASGSTDKTVRLWEAASGSELRQFTGHQDYVRSVAFSPDGKWLASGSDDSTARLWEIASGKELCQFTGHQAYVLSLAFSPDGKWLASGSPDKTVRLWEAVSGKELRQFMGHQASVLSVAFSPDGKWLASGSDDYTARLWEVASGQELHQFTGHQASVLSVAFSPDGKWLASGSDDNKTDQLWEVADGSTDNSIRLWEVASGKELRQFTGRRAYVRSVAFSPDGKWLASGSGDNSIRLWGAASGKELRNFTGHRACVRSVAFSPDGKWLASGSTDKTVRLWETASGKELHQFTGHEDYVLNLAFSPDGKWLASGGGKIVRLWEVTTGKELHQFTGHLANIWSVAFSPDGKWLASGGADNTVRLWEAASGKELRQFTGSQAYVIRSVAFNPAGKWLASGGTDNTVRLWEAASTKELRQFTGHQASVLSVAFSPDGKWLASGSADNTVRLWEATSGKELRQFTGHQASVLSVAFSPDEKWLASGSTDKTVRVWNLLTGECMAVLLSLPEGWVTFTPQGRYKFGGNVAGNFWHTIALCRFEPGELDDFIPGLRLKDDEHILP